MEVNSFIQRISLIIGLFFFLATSFAQKEIIVIDQQQKVKEKAILILPGLSDSNAKRKQQKKFFAHKGYDLYIPAFSVRADYVQSVEQLAQFYATQLKDYESVYVFSYIMGSWVFNDFYEAYQPTNVKRIVYDRSPLQERAPRIVKEHLHTLGWIFFGYVIVDFSDQTYTTLHAPTIEKGVIIENKATKFIRFFKKTALSYGPVSWEVQQFRQDFSDHFYVWLDHPQMYKRFDVIGEEVFHFFQTGKFSSTANRVPLSCDPFGKYR